MMKCEDALLSSDLFTNDPLFMSDFSADSLNLSGDNPFDFLNSAENLPSFSSDGFNTQNQNQASDFLENPQQLYYVANSKDENAVSSVPKINAQMGNLIFDNISNTAKDNTNDIPTVPSTPLPKITIPTVQPKDTEMKLTTPQQIRNIQPKPDTSSYRIVPIKAVSSAIQNAQPQTLKVHNSNSISGVEKITQSPKETVVKKVVPFSDLTLVNGTNAKKQVI